jgi:hypothetical protein
MNWKRIEERIAKQQEIIGKDRDKLDELISDLVTLRDDCEEAWGSLQDARDALSRLV